MRRISDASDQRCVGPAVRRTSGMSPVLYLKYKAKCFVIICGILADLGANVLLSTPQTTLFSEISQVS